jgi:hypothetical protein
MSILELLTLFTVFGWIARTSCPYKCVVLEALSLVRSSKYIIKGLWHSKEGESLRAKLALAEFVLQYSGKKLLCEISCAHKKGHSCLPRGQIDHRKDPHTYTDDPNLPRDPK